MVRLDSKLFKSKLAWRFFGLFIVCAFVPILAMAAMAYTHVAGRLEAQAFERLRGYAKAHGMSLFEHLALAEGQLQMLGTVLTSPAGKSDRFHAAAMEIKDKDQYFKRLGVYRQGAYRAVLGEPISSETIIPATERLTSRGETTLAIVSQNGRFPMIALVHRSAITTQPGDESCFLVGVLEPNFLWGLESGTILPPGIQWRVWDQRAGDLFSTLLPDEQSRLDLGAIVGDRSSGQVSVSLAAGEHYAAYWSLFIKPHFHAPQWTVLVMAPKSDVLAPFYRFKTLFPLVVLMSLAVVVLLSSVAIRRSLIPIDSLLEGARQVARGRFVHRVTVESGDEFQDLAQAFNRMSDQLDKQFKAISARSDVDRAILSLLDTEAIVSKILPSLNLFFPCMAGAITLLEEGDPTRGMTYSADSQGVATEMRASACQLPVAVQTLLNDRPDGLEIDPATGPFSFLKELEIAGVAAWVVLPIYHQGQLIALICLGVADPDDYTAADLEQARQLAHQLAVALSNAELIRELKILNMGTLDALARTVDAKSPWTAGHSERVMQLSLQIGKAMGLSAEQLTDMHHAALLHDIGKIGIPVSILDKKEPLTDDEFARIRTHPSIGARILHPISAYQRLIPVVEQHHERFDGRGYPKGLAGEAIHPAARIMALADAFDAMVSDRPYRKGMPLDKVRNIIIGEAGRQFDPEVVAAFERVVARKFPLAIVRSDDLADTEQALPQKVAQGR